uniref:Sodium/calcium exchanger membrane region domain-containing protein n=1 Tax=Chromera velia CCMP2878 TaxID=1169474 RepID=A0A0G4GYI9_9ALVE|eukprot:Cvel_23911.t1-p1 / transcript=Cvel_23911.t1 / gene=Cvel_23911 / organism=Chromera_velia_CCMP2878 / gene_product=Cation/calcium exchanger 5, putative / transcript_product=Cation/calcium exchanger 5, putative / location=Cvel_scaffold2522:9054-14042(+) / protein_length=843 / sequence_SO=supercontig / SO=protein_coding / is_pseudo=false
MAQEARHRKALQNEKAWQPLACDRVASLDPEERCETAMRCDDEKKESEIPYLTLSHCVLVDPGWICFCLSLCFFFWLGALSLLAEAHLCPALIKTSDALKLSEGTAGATVMAFGNAAGEIMLGVSVSLAAPTLAESAENLKISIGQLMGGALFTLCVVTGAVILAVPAETPLQVRPVDLIRDTTFMAAAGGTAIVFGLRGHVAWWIGGLLFAVYVLYVAIALATPPAATVSSSEMVDEGGEESGNQIRMSIQEWSEKGSETMRDNGGGGQQRGYVVAGAGGAADLTHPLNAHTQEEEGGAACVDQEELHLDYEYTPPNSASAQRNRRGTLAEMFGFSRPPVSAAEALTGLRMSVLGESGPTRGSFGEAREVNLHSRQEDPQTQPQVVKGQGQGEGQKEGRAPSSSFLQRSPPAAPMASPGQAPKEESREKGGGQAHQSSRLLAEGFRGGENEVEEEGSGTRVRAWSDFPLPLPASSGPSPSSARSKFPSPSAGSSHPRTGGGSLSLSFEGGAHRQRQGLRGRERERRWKRIGSGSLSLITRLSLDSDTVVTAMSLKPKLYVNAERVAEEEGWEGMSGWHRLTFIVFSPLRFLWFLTIPSLTGWNRAIFSLNPFCLSLFFSLFLQLSFDWTLSLLVVGRVGSFLLFALTRHNTKEPQGLWWALPVAFVMALWWMKTVSDELAATIKVVADVSGVDKTVIGMTVLSWAAGWPDVVACVALVRAGRANMSLAGALGGNVFMYFGGLSVILLLTGLKFQNSMGERGGQIPFLAGMQSVTAACCLAGICLVALVTTACCRWTLRRCLAWLLLVLYAVSLGVTISFEFLSGKSAPGDGSTAPSDWGLVD